MTKPLDENPELKLDQTVEDIINQLGEQIQVPRGPAVLAPGRQMSASAQTTDRIQVRDMQTLNTGELKSVYALLAYVAHNENIQQETVQAIVEASFGVNHITRIPHKDYEDVIRFLVDLRIDEMQN